MSRDINDTLIFVKVVEHGGFSAAARALDLPKTTVSRRIQELERRLGAALLKRTTRRLGLTEAGSVYIEFGRRMVRELDDAEAAVNQLHETPRGWLRVMLPYSLAVKGVTPILPEFFRRFPELKLDLVMGRDHLDLVSSDIDLVLHTGPLADSTMVVRRLCGYGSHVYASPSYVAQHGAPETPDDLRRHRALVLAAQRQAGRYLWPLKRAAAARDVQVDAVLAVNDPATLLGPLLAGVGVALMPDGYADITISAGGLVRLLPEWDGPAAELNAIFPPGRAVPPKVRVFVDFLIEQLAGMSCMDVGQHMARLVGIPVPVGEPA